MKSVSPVQRALLIECAGRGLLTPRNGTEARSLEILADRCLVARLGGNYRITRHGATYLAKRAGAEVWATVQRMYRVPGATAKRAEITEACRRGMLRGDGSISTGGMVALER